MIACMYAQMNSEVTLFGEGFLTTVDRAYVENCRTNPVSICFMNPQPTPTIEFLRAKTAPEARWIIHKINYYYNLLL